MGTIASQITSLTIVYSTVYSGADQRKHQGSASLAFVRGIHRGPVNSPHKWPVTGKMFPFDDVIMKTKVCFWFLPISWRYFYTTAQRSWSGVCWNNFFVLNILTYQQMNYHFWEVTKSFEEKYVSIRIGNSFVSYGISCHIRRRTPKI